MQSPVYTVVSTVVWCTGTDQGCRNLMWNIPRELEWGLGLAWFWGWRGWIRLAFQLSWKGVSNWCVSPSVKLKQGSQTIAWGGGRNWTEAIHVMFVYVVALGRTISGNLLCTSQSYPAPLLNHMHPEGKYHGNEENIIPWLSWSRYTERFVMLVYL